MDEKIRKAVLEQVNFEHYGLKSQYATDLNNVCLISGDGSELLYPPPPNVRLIMSNLPATDRDGQPILMGADEMVRCRLGLERAELSQSKRKHMLPEELKMLKF
jgi:hypothetical protein